MKKVLLLTVVSCLIAGGLFAAEVNNPSLRKYVEKSLDQCPGQSIKIETSDQPGPANFKIYRVTQTSNDSTCGRVTYAMISPSGQALVANALELPSDPRRPEAKIQQVTDRMLRKQTSIDISPTKLPDGLLQVNVTSQSEFGTTVLHGYLDASRRFFIVGRRGDIKTDPGTTLLSTLGARNAATRGNSKSSIRILELSDLQCPTCKRAHEAIIEPFMKKNGSKVSFSRLDLPLFEHHDWSMYAALGAHAIQRVSPEHYWDYVDYIFANQEMITKDTVEQTIQDFCAIHNLSWKKLEPYYRSENEKQALIKQVGAAFDSGIFVTPTFIVNGQVIGYGNDGANIKAYLDSLVAPKAASKPAHSKKK